MFYALFSFFYNTFSFDYDRVVNHIEASPFNIKTTKVARMTDNCLL